MDSDIGKHLSSKHCSICDGDGDGFKCPKCGYVTTVHNPLHFQACAKGSMVQVKCKACQEAECNCKCLHQNNS